MKRQQQNGQTIIMLLVFMMLAITLALSAIAVVIINTRGDVAYQSGEQARFNAEAGIENAMIRLERDPTYRGESLLLDNGAATISVSGSGTLTITSTGSSGEAVRTLTATVSAANPTISLNTWSETP
jgi:hypothetical protein